MKKTIYFRIGYLQTLREISRKLGGKCLILDSRISGDYCYASIMYYDEYDLEDLEDEFDNITGEVLMRQEDLLYKHEYLR